MLNVLSEWLSEERANKARGFGMHVAKTPSVVATSPHEAEFSWPADDCRTICASATKSG